MKNSNSRLSYERQQLVLSTLLPIVDKSWDLIDAMSDEGWSRVMPRLRFEESFGSAAEVSEHRKIAIEERKIRIATPNIRYNIGGPPFISPHLAELRAQQSAQSDASTGEDATSRWKRYLDPCVRRLERLRSLDPGEFRVLFSKVEAEERDCIAREVAAINNPTAEQIRGEELSPQRCFFALLKRYASPLGFEFDETRSWRSETVFSKPVVDNWRLCLSPEPLAWYPGRNDGEICWFLACRLCPFGIHSKLGHFRIFSLLNMVNSSNTLSFCIEDFDL